ncbi:MAG: type III pantothenate kinase [Candidatus Omnitrophota bacterium]
MLLAVDIGNTNISFGVFKGNKIVKRFNILTGSYCAKRLKKNLGRADISDSIICSVVPKATDILARDLEKLLAIRAHIIGKDLKAPIKNLYRKAKQVGQDRLVNAYAGVKLYGSPLIVIDFGTAITFDAISKRSEYLGGAILPGLQISLDALHERTALLPKVKLNKPKGLIGKDTKNSMLSGIIYGFASLSDDLSLRIKLKIGRNAKVIGTGGNINLIKKYCRNLDIIDRDLTLKGLRLIY